VQARVKQKEPEEPPREAPGAGGWHARQENRAQSYESAGGPRPKQRNGTRNAQRLAKSYERNGRGEGRGHDDGAHPWKIRSLGLMMTHQ